MSDFDFVNQIVELRKKRIKELNLKEDIHFLIFGEACGQYWDSWFINGEKILIENLKNIIGISSITSERKDSSLLSNHKIDIETNFGKFGFEFIKSSSSESSRFNLYFKNESVFSFSYLSITKPVEIIEIFQFIDNDWVKNFKLFMIKVEEFVKINNQLELDRVKAEKALELKEKFGITDEEISFFKMPDCNEKAYLTKEINLSKPLNEKKLSNLQTAEGNNLNKFSKKNEKNIFIFFFILICIVFLAAFL